MSCPCALSLATPVAYTVALLSVRHVGVVINAGRFLERLADVTRIVFDKTGTLTLGRLRIENAVLVGSLDEARALDIAGALERDSRHPIALAFTRGATIEVEAREIVPGKGVSGQIDGQHYRLGKPGFAAPGLECTPPDAEGLWVMLAGDEPIAWFRLRDEIREESRSVIERLGRSADLSILTGDASDEGARIAGALGIADVGIGLDPAAKIEHIRRYQQAGDVVMMVGDGVNDAGSMSAADTSLAVSPADVVVQEAADATLLSGNLGGIESLIRYSKRVRRIIRQNVIWAVGYNASLIPSGL
ncbi:MAG: HAD-IC family P-type ATPase [Gammaproteobacteria bacterium]|nr:HAD-IC family P-type ATPase [Gammaproteobacteria bacterium]